jgi:hypothetical protein
VPAERVALEVHLRSLAPDVRELWDRFASLVARAGPSETIATRSRIAFKARRIFAGGFFAGGRLELFFDLPEPVPEAQRDRRFRAVWQQGRRLWTHRLAIESVDEIDDRLARWLDQSWRTYSLPPSER